MIAGRPASVLSGGGDDATMYALGVLKWWRVAPRPVRRNLDFYAEISEATVKNDNKQQKKNSYGKGKVSKNKVNPD